MACNADSKNITCLYRMVFLNMCRVVNLYAAVLVGSRGRKPNANYVYNMDHVHIHK